MSIQLEPSWLNLLRQEFQKSYMQDLKSFLQQERAQNQLVYPPNSLVFNALNSLPFEQVKVVILGQDPYHGVGQAHGLSFSVPDGIKIPPSLMNIFKELSDDIPNFKTPQYGNLTSWVKQGVLLLNASLTVRANSAGSHQGKGWEQFTDTIIRQLSQNRSGLVFMLWGNFAKAKIALIDTDHHLVLSAAHPSPFSAHSGFLGCKHFSKANAYLKKQGISEIDWNL